MFSVYAIKNQNDKIYIGHTATLSERLMRHNGLLKNKIKSYTSKNKGIWSLVYEEKFCTRGEALQREKELKSSRGRNFIRNMIKF